jgi:hypothetical protein
VIPSSLSFTATQNGANPSPQNLSVTNVGAGGSVPFTFTSNQPWLLPASGSGSTPGIVAVSIDITGLAPGVYSGSVTFNSTCGSPTVIVGVTLTISSAGGVTPCAPVDSLSGNPVNGVYVSDLSLFIIPATALYDNLIPHSQLSVSETAVQGRREIIVDFNGSEGMWKRDLGTIFTWSLTSRTALYVWQPSIIPFPMGDDIYYRLSFHALMSSLGMVGWGHVREMNIAHQSTADLTLLLTFDTGPAITLTVPNSGGQYAKTKVTIPANKFKMVEVLVSSAAPFKLYGSDLEMKIRQWGSDGVYQVQKPVVD